MNEIFIIIPLILVGIGVIIGMIGFIRIGGEHCPICQSHISKKQIINAEKLKIAGIYDQYNIGYKCPKCGSIIDTHHTWHESNEPSTKECINAIIQKLPLQISKS